MYEFDYAGLLALAGAFCGQLGKTAATERTLQEALEALGPERSRRRAEVLVELARVHVQQQAPWDGARAVKALDEVLDGAR